MAYESESTIKMATACRMWLSGPLFCKLSGKFLTPVASLHPTHGLCTGLCLGFLIAGIILPLYPIKFLSGFSLLSPLQPLPMSLFPHIISCFIPIIGLAISSCKFPPLPFSPISLKLPPFTYYPFSLSCCLMIFPADELCSQYWEACSTTGLVVCSWGAPSRWK